MGNNKQLMGAGLMALSLFLFWPLAYGEYQKISILRAAVTERDGAIAEYTAIIANVKKLKQDYEQRKSELATFAGVVPVKKSTAEILSSLETIATQTGNVISEVSFSVPILNSEPYASLQITVEGQGSYSALKNMLDAFDKNIPLIDVQDIEMTVDQKSTQLNYKIQAVTYFLNDATTAK